MNLLCSLRVASKAHHTEFCFNCPRRHVRHTNWFPVKFQPHGFAEGALGVLAAGVACAMVRKSKGIVLKITRVLTCPIIIDSSLLLK